MEIKNRLHLSDKQIRRFLSSYVKLPNGCWEWRAQRYSNGYGRFNCNEKYHLAHRLAWRLSGRKETAWPNKRILCHTCDNRACINPDHLFLGTQKDNAQDMVKKGRSANNERSAMAKLPNRYIRVMRIMSKYGDCSADEIATVFKCSNRHVTAVLRGEFRDKKKMKTINKAT